MKRDRGKGKGAFRAANLEFYTPFLGHYFRDFYRNENDEFVEFHMEQLCARAFLFYSFFVNCPNFVRTQKSTPSFRLFGQV